MTKTKRGHRPPRAVASARALAALAEAGIDAADVDPRLILQSIAADTSAPASARVSACRMLLASPAPARGGESDDDGWRDLIGKRK